jgi:signal transduction histidine kinase
VQILGHTGLTSFHDILTDHPANKRAFHSDAPCESEVKRAPFEVQVYHKNGSKRWLQMSETSVITKEGIKTEGIAHDITYRKIRELAIENILNAFTDNPGRSFYETMILQLAKTLECDASFFALQTEEQQETAKTAAFYHDGKIRDNFEYKFSGTPCEQMQIDGAFVLPSGVREAYPGSDMLKQMKIEGYAGIPLTDKSGSQIGVLVALWKERAFDEALILPVLKLFSEYTLIELERQREARKHTLLEEQLRHSQKMDAVGQLAGGIAHDFNNMLMGIMGASDLLKMRLKDDEEAHEYHQMIRNSSRRAAELTRQLLTFARKQSICSTKVNVHETIVNAVSLLSSTLDKRINITTKLTAKDCIITGDSTQLQNAIMNLGINAAHAMPDGGEIKIETRSMEIHDGQCEAHTFPDSPTPCMEITVSDSGIGIPPENLNKIFEPFFTTKTLGEGTGLGLSAVLGTVQQHQGTINVESEPDRGTIFRINFPVTSADIEHQESSGDSVEGSGHILLVEDEPDIQITVKEMLKQLGYDVTVADNGIQGLECFKQAKGKFDLVILDMVMPEMNGKDCFFKLKEIDPAVKVILSSGYANQADMQVMKAAGLDAVMTKPFSSAKLSQTAMRVMKKR